MSEKSKTNEFNLNEIPAFMTAEDLYKIIGVSHSLTLSDCSDLLARRLDSLARHPFQMDKTLFISGFETIKQVKNEWFYRVIINNCLYIEDVIVAEYGDNYNVELPTNISLYGGNNPVLFRKQILFNHLSMRHRMFDAKVTEKQFTIMKGTQDVRLIDDDDAVRFELGSRVFHMTDKKKTLSKNDIFHLSKRVDGIENRRRIEGEFGTIGWDHKLYTLCEVQDVYIGAPVIPVFMPFKSFSKKIWEKNETPYYQVMGYSKDPAGNRTYSVGEVKDGIVIGSESFYDYELLVLDRHFADIDKWNCFVDVTLTPSMMKSEEILGILRSGLLELAEYIDCEPNICLSAGMYREKDNGPCYLQIRNPETMTKKELTINPFATISFLRSEKLNELLKAIEEFTKRPKN